MIKNRKIFHKANPKDMLNEFVLFGYIKLECAGGVAFTTDRTQFNEDVEIFQYFKKGAGRSSGSFLKSIFLPA